MFTRTIALRGTAAVVLGIVALGVAPAFSQVKFGSADASRLKNIAQANIAEVESGTHALGKSSNEEARSSRRR